MMLLETLDQFLARRGFVLAPVRRVASCVFLLSLGLLLAGLGLLPWTDWPFWLGVGAMLSAWNFISLAYFLQLAFHNQVKKKNISSKLIFWQIIGTNLRLFITGIMVYIALVIFSANVLALLAGLSLTVLLMPVLLLTRNDPGPSR